MNRRQKKKNFKKKYGYNPPSKKQMKRTVYNLAEVVKRIFDNVKGAANKLFLAGADITNKIRNMSEGEFEEAFSKATSQQQEMMKRVREIAAKEKRRKEKGEKWRNYIK